MVIGGIRISREFLLMETARLWAQRGTCSRLTVGVVIERDGRILVQGYNGAPSGMEHCSHTCTCDFRLGKISGHSPYCMILQPCRIAVHAEASAIAHAARIGVPLEGARLISTHMPCSSCAMLIINAGITHIIYDEPYRDTSGLKMMMDANLNVQQYDIISP